MYSIRLVVTESSKSKTCTVMGVDWGGDEVKTKEDLDESDEE